VTEKLDEPVFLLCAEAIPESEINDTHNLLGIDDLGLGNGRGHGQLFC